MPSTTNNVVKKLKLDPKQEVKQELVLEAFVATEYEGLSLIKEELDCKVDSHGVEFKAPSSLQSHLGHGYPGQDTVLLECGVCQQKFQDILDINNHWQSEDCWSGPRQVGTKIKSPGKKSEDKNPDNKTPGKKSEVKSPDKKTPVKSKIKKKAKGKTPRKNTQVKKRVSKTNKGS